MGKGDKKTKKGKRKKGSFGNIRIRKNRPNKYIKKYDLRFWSIERLFSFIGKHDFTSSIIFKNDSDSFKAYNKNITGELYYTTRERRLLNIKLNSGFKKETDGKVFFKVLLKEGLTNEQINNLLKEGFNNKDILRIDYYPYKHNDSYYWKRNKRLSDPIILKINNRNSALENYQIEYNFYKNRILQNDSLANHEKIKMAALQKGLRIQETENKFDFKKIVNENLVDFEFKVENILYDIGEITKFPVKVMKNKSDFIKAIIYKEFQKSGIDLNKGPELLKYQKYYFDFIMYGFFFQEKILLYSSNLKIILTFEGLLHIVYRHCSSFIIGEANLNKSRIPYELKHFEQLIENCIQSIEDEIENHFIKFPDKKFSKYGDELIRFNGDDYEIHINSNGVIETFYNHKK